MKERKNFKDAHEKRIFDNLSELQSTPDGIWLIKMTKDGSDAYQARDFEKAVEIFEKLVKLKPNMEMYWYVLLESLSYLARWEDMIAVGEQAEKKDINFGPNYLWMGDAYSELGKKDLSISYYHRGLESLMRHKERGPTMLNTIGNAYIKLSEYEKSLKYSKEALKLEPGSEHHLHNIGLAYKEMKNYKMAIKYYEESLKCNPKHSYAWFDLGLIYEELNDLEKAIECFEKSVEFSPQWIKLREKLMEIKPDSKVLDKKALELKKEEEKKDKDGYKLFEKLHERSIESIEEKSQAILKKVLNKTYDEWVQFLEAEIRKCEYFLKNIKQPLIDKVGERVSSNYPNVYQMWETRKEFNENHLKKLKEDPNYIQELRNLIKKDDQKKQKIREDRQNSLKENLNTQIKMNGEELISFLKQDISSKEEVIEELKIRNPFSPFVKRLEEVLIQKKDELKNLENDHNYIYIIRTQLQYALDNLGNIPFNARFRSSGFMDFKAKEKDKLDSKNLSEEEKDARRRKISQGYLLRLQMQLKFLGRLVIEAPNEVVRKTRIEQMKRLEYQIRMHELFIKNYDNLKEIMQLTEESKEIEERIAKGEFVDDLINQNKFALEMAHKKDKETCELFKVEKEAEKKRIEQIKLKEEIEAQAWLNKNPDIKNTLPEWKKRIKGNEKEE